MLDKLYEMMDVTEALSFALRWAKSISGIEARILACLFVVIDLVLAWLTWYFDIESTLIWSSQITDGVAKTLATDLLVYVPIITLIITIAPTALRQSLSNLAGSGFQIAAAVIFAVGLFDIRTDWPRVKAFFDLDAVWNLFSVFGPAQKIVWGICRLGFLFMATDGFEILLVVCVVVTFVLIFRSGAGSTAARGGR